MTAPQRPIVDIATDSASDGAVTSPRWARPAGVVDPSPV